MYRMQLHLPQSHEFRPSSMPPLMGQPCLIIFRHGRTAHLLLDVEMGWQDAMRFATLAAGRYQFFDIFAIVTNQSGSWLHFNFILF